jgi:hypothetical protein
VVSEQPSQFLLPQAEEYNQELLHFLRTYIYEIAEKPPQKHSEASHFIRSAKTKTKSTRMSAVKP